MERWASFDCYGTLIDWNGGIRAELARVFGEERADDQLARYHEIEPELERDGGMSYRQVLTEAMRRLGAPRRRGARARRVAARLARVRRGARRTHRSAHARLEARDPLEHRHGLHRRVAGADRRAVRRGRRRSGDRLLQARAPALGGVLSPHTCAARGARPRRRHRSSTTSRPANELGLRSIWINRLGERPAGVAPTRELTDLSLLADTLDELVPADG